VHFVKLKTASRDKLLPWVRTPGRASLEPDFEWTPHQMLSLIEIIDKAIPGKVYMGKKGP
jgi:hypothetical protein